MLKEFSRHLPSATGVAALVAWAIALQQSLPRMLAGPICSARGDAFVFAGHCPACYVRPRCRSHSWRLCSLPADNSARGARDLTVGAAR